MKLILKRILVLYCLIILFCNIASKSNENENNFLRKRANKYEFKFTVEDFNNYMTTYKSQNPDLLYSENSTDQIDLKNINFVMGKKKQEGQVVLTKCNDEEMPQWGSPLKEKQFSWYKVLNILNNDKNDLEKVKLMKKMLVFRYRVMLSIIIKAIEEYFGIKDTFLDGNFKLFKSKSFLYNPSTIGTNVTGLDQKEGYFKFENLGSANNDSDIDLVVEFIYTDEEINNNITYKLDPTQKLIQTWNKYFVIYKSSLNAFDVNLYSGDFSIQSIVDIYTTLGENEKNTFKIANRLSVLSLIYKDSLSRISRPANKPEIIGVDEKLTNLYNNSGVCASIMFSDGNISKRNHDYTVRNVNMRAAIVEAIADFNRANTLRADKKKYKSEYLKLLCHILKSNFEANEAYVPFGSVLDIKAMQGKFIAGRVLTHDELMDSILMNFAYLVEHFYKNKIIDQESFSKFGKYLGRIYFSVAEKTEPQELVCWKEKIEIYDAEIVNIVNDAKYLSKLREYLTNGSQRRYKDANTKKDEEKKSSQLIKDLYTCVKDYAFNVVSTTPTSTLSNESEVDTNKKRKLKLK